MYIYIYLYICICICMYIYIYIYVYTYAYRLYNIHTYHHVLSCLCIKASIFEVNILFSHRQRVDIPNIPVYLPAGHESLDENDDQPVLRRRFWQDLSMCGLCHTYIFICILICIVIYICVLYNLYIHIGMYVTHV